MPLLKQTAIVCEQVKKIDELSEGYNIVGRSQGNAVARGVIEFCDGGPIVKNYISLGGPHAGIASIRFCGQCGSGLVNALIKLGIYSHYVQDHLAPSGYFKIPTDIAAYEKGCKFLPKLNNEIAGERNSTYKERFSSLQNLVLIMFEHDTVLIPKETSWFGYYPDGACSPVLPPNETTLYIEDWIGLKTLDEAGKVQFVSVPGSHLNITESGMQEYIVPYLKDENETSLRTVTDGSSFNEPWPLRDRGREQGQGKRADPAGLQKARKSGRIRVSSGQYPSDTYELGMRGADSCNNIGRESVGVRTDISVENDEL